MAGRRARAPAHRGKGIADLDAQRIEIVAVFADNDRHIHITQV